MKKIFTLLLVLFINNLYAQSDIPLPKQEQEEQERKEYIQNSETKLLFRNNTGKEIYFCYVMYDKNEASWTSVGWYKIQAYKTKNLPLGDYAGPIYIHGETQNLVSNTLWGDKWNFCIDPIKPFKILNSDQIDCPKKAKFYKYNVVKGQNKWTFNP